jgi:hypothetical protein
MPNDTLYVLWNRSHQGWRLQEPPPSTRVQEKKKARVDTAGVRREGFFGSSGKGTWLTESDVEFFTGGTIFFLCPVHAMASSLARVSGKNGRL